MKFKFARNQPLTLNNYEDKFIFSHPDERDEYDRFLFGDQPEYTGGCEYTSWNQIQMKLSYDESLWLQLSKINYIKISVDGTTTPQYYYINQYEILQTKKIKITCELDIFMTYQSFINFKQNASVFVDRMHINRWQSLESVYISSQLQNCLAPNWDSDSALWQPETKLDNMSNKIVEKTIDLFLQIPKKWVVDYIPYVNFLYYGQYVYMVFKYNTNSETGNINYKVPMPKESSSGFIANPMPFFIIPLTKNKIEYYNKFIDSPYLQGIYYSQIPWFNPTQQPPRYPYTDNDIATNPLLHGTDWKTVYDEILPTEFLLVEGICRADLINSFFLETESEFYETFRHEPDQYQYFGYVRDVNKFSPDNEPKLYMYPFFEIDYIKGRRTPFVLHNERWHAGITLNNFRDETQIHILETFTPFNINSYRIFTQGMYNTGHVDLKYSMDLSGTNNLISFASPYKAFLNSYLANYNTGRNIKGLGVGTGILDVFTNAMGGAITGAMGGAMLGSEAGAVVGGGVGLLKGIFGAVHSGLEFQQEKNKLIDLARQPDTANKNDNPDTYLDIALLNDNQYAGRLRLKSLTEYNRWQVAFYLHKFGYTYNRNLVVDNWDKLLIRETWNFVKIEQFSNCIDLEQSNIPWQAINMFDIIFNKGIRLWTPFLFDRENKLFDYDLPNWEKGIKWDGIKFNISSSDGSMNWKKVEA